MYRSMPCNLNNLTTYCNTVNNKKLIRYNKLVTGGNDPSISKAMRYSQYVKTTRTSSVTASQYSNMTGIIPAYKSSCMNK